MTIESRPLVQVALSLGPNDTPTEDDWTDLSDRVLEFSMDRGRDDRTQDFDPGTCTLLLDNDDRDLDPLRTGSLVEMAAGKGLPLCPIRVTVDYDGEPRIFTGYIGPEPWVPLSTPVGGKRKVRLQAFDRLALMALLGMPSSPFAMQVRRLEPDWWIRGMLPTQIVASAATEIADSSGNGYDGVVSGGSGVVYNVESLVDGDDDTALGHEADVSIYTDASALTVAKADVTMCCVWRGIPAASDQEIMRQRNGSTVRWRVECQTTGDLVAIIYGAGGTPTDFVAAPANPNDSGGRWDDDTPHIIFVQIEGGTRMRIRVDSSSDSTTTDIPSTVAGRVIFGGGVQGATFDEVAYWNRLLPNADVDRIASAFMGTDAPFEGDSFQERLERWWDTTIHPRGGSDLEVHIGATEDPELRGITSVPDNLADALRLTVDSHFGTVWATRDGTIRARTLSALSNTTSHELDYIEPVALLTDVEEPVTALTVVRRSQPEFTGPRLDRVINVYRITIAGTTYEQRNDESILRYGERVRSWTSEAHAPWYSPPVLPTVEDLADVATPSWDVGTLTVWPLIDPGAAQFVFTDCELERAIDLQWTDGGIVFTTRLQIQGESWTWKGSDLQVDLRVGRSVGAPTITEEFAVGAVFLFATEDRNEMTAETGSELTATI
jgi:hypothetical protein